MERVGRVARAQARGSPARARLRGGALSGQVLASARMVRRRRTRCRRRARRGANRAHGLLDGRRRLGRGRERADGRGGDRPRALDSRSARRVDAAREAARRVPRRARSLAPRHPRRVRIPFAERVRPRARARRRGPLRPHSRRPARDRAALAVGEARRVAEGRPLGGARGGGASPLRGRLLVGRARDIRRPSRRDSRRVRTSRARLAQRALSTYA